MTIDPTTPLTVTQDVTDPEWQRLITRFYRRRCDECATPLADDAPSNQRHCSRLCADRHRQRRMMTAIRRLDEGRAA